MSYPTAPELWGILNVTPDSFSDGGLYLDPNRAVARAQQMVAEGAHCIDVGGQSTRPAGRDYGAGAARVSPEDERQRVLPVVRSLCQQGVRVSVDTTTPSLARACLDAGALYINDTSCGRHPELLAQVAQAEAQIVLMHNRAQGQTSGANAHYAHCVQESWQELEVAIDSALQAGISSERIWVDPGLGFAKNAEDSLHILAELRYFTGRGYRVLVGASRKSFLAHATKGNTAAFAPPDQRLGASLASAIWAAHQGAHALRVHDVAEHAQALTLLQALTCTSSSSRSNVPFDPDDLP